MHTSGTAQVVGDSLNGIDGGFQIAVLMPER